MRFLVAYSASPDPVADGLRGPTFKERGREKEERECITSAGWIKGPDVNDLPRVVA